MNLANLSPEIIADLYESLLVSKAIRKKYSVHATRLEIAEYLLQQLPIDQLLKNERKVFEPFCGHAPFLTATMTRMRSIEIEPMTGEHRHDYFQQMLVGMEVSAFSRELGICSLILADDANGDSWQIDCGDSFRSPEFDKHLQWANIVLCNPPFEDFKNTDLGKPENAIYDTQAAEALHRVLLYPPKMLGFVLPRLFVDSPKYNSLREKIVENYKDIQVLTLPEKAFRETQTETALLIANNAAASSNRYFSANVSEAQWDKFRISRKPFDAHDSPSLKRNVKGSPLLWRPPLFEIWNYLEKNSKMNDVAEIHRGIEYSRPVKECVFDSPQPHTLPGLQVHDGYLEAYFVKSRQHLSVAPQEMLYKAYQLPWHRPKLLVNYLRSGIGFWRLSGSVDLERLVASHNFYGLWPRLAMPLETLAAVVNSPLANAYSFTLSHGRHNTLGTLKSTPVPEFTSEQTELIVSLVQEYSEKRREWSVGSNREEYLKRRCKELLYQIDAVVLEAYNLPADLEKELLSRFEGVKRNHFPFEFIGYGEEYRLAKVALEREKIYRVTMKLYQSLVDKKYDVGISDSEQLEMKALDKQLNAIEKIYYNTLQPV